MTVSLAGAGRGRDHRHDGVCPVVHASWQSAFSFFGDTHMTWTTPTATDFRFGFEITMYIATR